MSKSSPSRTPHGITPGPWLAKLDQFDFTNEGERYVVFGDPNGGSYGRVALVAPTATRVARGKNKTPYNAPDDERDANARLIAAAPDLLAALEASLTANIAPMPKHYRAVGDEPVWAVNARAAIKKARGK